MNKLLGLAALAGLLAVAAGAFASHALEGDARAAELMRTAATYAMWHALAVLAYAALGGRSPLVSGLYLLGIALFSGSLVVLALGGPRLVGVITPFGGLAFIAGWLLFALEAWRGGLAALPRP